MPKIRLHTTQDEINHFNRLNQYARQVSTIYNSAVKEFQRLAETLKIDPSKPFSFSDYPQTNDRVKRLINKIVGDVSNTIQFGMFTEWEKANDLNDGLVKRLFQIRTNKKGKTYARYLNRNNEALQAFQARKENGLGLSDRVWKNTMQFQKEIELSLGIGDGKSAAALSRDLKQYLNDPDKLFRRVRDKHGVLQLSKAAEAYHPGQGVYRSSVKNTQRLTRTETNMAYRLSDWTRWQQMDFIVGYEVRLSNRNTHCPLCEKLKGKYPKTFRFVGWHPHCMCYVVPILMTDRELDKLEDAILSGQDAITINSSNAVKKLPAGFTSWVSDNLDKINTSTNKPYFIRDNFFKGPFKLPKGNKLFTLTSANKRKLRDLGFNITGDEKNYNLISGFDLVEFDKLYISILNENNVTRASKQLYLSKKDVRFEYSGNGVTLVRTFYKNDTGAKEVHHDFFQIPERMQGAGFSKKVFQELYKQYRSAGVDMIDVQANIDVGGYTWARYGFMGKNRDSISGVISKAQKVLNSSEMKVFNKWLKENDKIGRYNMRALTEMTFGKKLLLGTNWYGNIDLRNEVERLVFEGYLNR